MYDDTDDTTERDEPTDTDANPQAAWGSFVELLVTVAMIVFFTVGIRIFLVQPFVVDGQSMEPTFQNQEYILVDKLSYRLREPERGEVVVFHPPGRVDNFIKRIIGLPGDTVEIRGHNIYVNGTQLEEDYLDSSLYQTILPETDTTITVEPDNYFVLGDNRDHSKDSREIGQIPKGNLIGRTWVVLFPVRNIHLVNRPTYNIVDTSPKSSSGALVRAAVEI
jgi:signal peptidase I